jgi:hypothetical protein
VLTKCGLQADRFVLDELFRFEQRIRAAYESFDFPKGEINNDIQPRRTLSLTIYSHSPVLMESTNVLNLFSTFYFEMIRDTLYSEAKGAPSRAIIKAVLQSVRACLLRSPFELLEFDALTASSSPPLPHTLSDPQHRLAISWPYRALLCRGASCTPDRSSEPLCLGLCARVDVSCKKENNMVLNLRAARLTIHTLALQPKAWVDLEAREEMTQLLDMKSLVQGLIDQGRAEK